MKKKNFVSMLMSLIGVLLFSLGMCMCLVSEWNAFKQGVVVSIIGIAVLLVMLIVRRKMEVKPAIKFNGKAIGTVIFGIIGTVVLGVGMCMVMVWDMMIPGIALGIVGIVLLVCLIPICKGLK